MSVPKEINYMTEAHSVPPVAIEEREEAPVAPAKPPGRVAMKAATHILATPLSPLEIYETD